MIKKNVPLWVYIFIVALGLIVMALSACSTQAKLARKKEAAYQTVLTDSAMFRSIGDKYRKINPCVNDTIIGETEVLILSDTQYIRNTDTLVEFMPDTVRVTVNKTNTVTRYVVDNKAVQELHDSLHDARVREAQQDGQIIQLTKDRETEKKDKEAAEKSKKQLSWGIWGLIALLLISHGLRSFPDISKLFKN